MPPACAFEQAELEIPANLGMLHEAREWAADAAGAFGLCEGDCFQVKLAMSEAVTNAIIHGSGAHGASVRLAAYGEDDMLVFEVSDSGRDHPDTDPVDRLDEGGRGLELVSMVMDEVQLTRREGGGLLRFAKRRMEGV